MAKKTVAGYRDPKAGGKYIKVIKAVKSEKTGAISFREEIVPEDRAKEII